MNTIGNNFLKIFRNFVKNSYDVLAEFKVCEAFVRPLLEIEQHGVRLKVIDFVLHLTRDPLNTH